MLYHIARGSVDYTIVGSPTIVDNVLTDITANDYLSIGTYSGDTPTSIEIGSSFKTSNTNIFGNAVIGRLTGADTGIFWGNSSFPGRICFKHRVSYDNGTTWTAVESKSAALSLNTRYYVKFIISLAEQKLTGYVSTDNINWTSYVANFNSGAILEGLTSIAIGKIFGHNASPLPIYLDYTYIKVNGKPWFGICPIEVKKHQIMGPVGYTVVGSPTITDGVASNFSLSSYCLVNTQFAPENYSWEEQICFKLDYPGERKNMALINSTLSDYLFPKIAVVTDNSTRLTVQPCLSGDGTSWSITQEGKVVSYDYSKKSWVKLTYSDGTYTLKLKQEGEDFRVVATYENKPVIYQSPNATSFSIGVDIGASDIWKSFFIGSIYLNETYIKVNGKLWFWQPQETKRIVVNGVEVWTKPE